jgi:hypothetical protein
LGVGGVDEDAFCELLNSFEQLALTSGNALVHGALLGWSFVNLANRSKCLSDRSPAR